MRNPGIVDQTTPGPSKRETRKKKRRKVEFIFFIIARQKLEINRKLYTKSNTQVEKYE